MLKRKVFDQEESFGMFIAFLEGFNLLFQNRTTHSNVKKENIVAWSSNLNQCEKEKIINVIMTGGYQIV